jgi:urea transport system ATP-binding protein
MEAAAHRRAVASPSRASGTELELRDLRRRFGGVAALDGVSLSVSRGELLGIIGPNGAGKSTLFGVICGLIRPSTGRVVFGGRDITGTTPASINRLGIARKYQNPTVFESLTVRQNLVVAGRGKWSTTELLRSRRATDADVDQILDLLRLDRKADREAGELSHGEKQWLEIGLILANRPRLLLLDEPTAGMTVRETRETERLLLELGQEHTIVVIEHDIAFIRAVAQRVVVMHQGRLLTVGPMAEVEADPRVRDVYLGRDAAEGGHA